MLHLLRPATRRCVTHFIFSAIFLEIFLLTTSALAAPCANLASTALPHATITSAEIVPAGAFVLPATDSGEQGGRSPRFEGLPEFCRIAATSKPTADSDIKIEVWLPVSGWDGKLQGTGNGCFGGAISYTAMRDVLQTGTAAAATDTGHDSHKGCFVPGDGAFALGHPEKLRDFGERAYHEMTVDAKILISAFYGNAPKLSFLDECGGGSREAMSEVQRYPEDWDAVSAGGLVGYSTHHVLAQLWAWQATHKTEASYIPPSKYPIIHAAALADCDTKDGVKDGVISEPTRCKFDPAVIECKGADAPNCLTAPQVEAARTLYAAVTNPRTKERLFGPLYPGSELAWGAVAGPQPFAYAIDFFKYAAFKDPSWDIKTRPINFDSDVALADAPENLVLNASDPDISKFIDRGGKLFMIGGWADTAVATSSNTDYFDALIEKMDKKRLQESVRFYMVPGMGHCPGKEGASAYYINTSQIIQDWKEKGTAPDPLIATHYANGVEDRKVLICQYPRVAIYKGKGDTNDPGNFSCKAR